MADPEAFVAPAYIRSSAARRTRLINFTASYTPAGYTLAAQHKAELDKLLAFVSQTTSFSYWLVGYASKRGAAGANMALSANRAMAVEQYLASKNALFADEDRLERFVPRGDQGYIADDKDNSADERAVEVHIFLGDVKPPKPPAPSQPLQKPPLPGGTRDTNWQVASPGGVTVTAPIGGGFNVWFIKNVKMNETRGYLQPVAAAGVSLSLSGLGTVWRAVQGIITGGSYAAPDFSDVSAPHPVTFEEVEQCLVRVTGGGAALVYGANAFITTFSSAGYYVYDSAGLPMKTTSDLWQYVNAGENWGLGAGLQTAIGPLKRVGG